MPLLSLPTDVLVFITKKNNPISYRDYIKLYKIYKELIELHKISYILMKYLEI